MLQLAQSVNLALRFGLELCALAGLAYWGWQASDALLVRVVATLGAPLLAAAVWGVWVAPNSKRRLPDPQRLVPEALVFGSAAPCPCRQRSAAARRRARRPRDPRRVLLEVLGTSGA